MKEAGGPHRCRTVLPVNAPLSARPHAWSSRGQLDYPRQGVAARQPAGVPLPVRQPRLLRIGVARRQGLRHEDSVPPYMGGSAEPRDMASRSQCRCSSLLRSIKMEVELGLRRGAVAQSHRP